MNQPRAWVSLRDKSGKFIALLPLGLSVTTLAPIWEACEKAWPGGTVGASATLEEWAARDLQGEGLK